MQVFENIRIGQAVAAMALKSGQAVFCPWLDYQLYLVSRCDVPITKEQFQANSMAWLEVSEELWVLPNWSDSIGTVREMNHAKALGIKTVFLNQSEVDIALKRS